MRGYRGSYRSRRAQTEKERRRENIYWVISYIIVGVPILCIYIKCIIDCW